MRKKVNAGINLLVMWLIFFLLLVLFTTVLHVQSPFNLMPPTPTQCVRCNGGRVSSGAASHNWRNASGVMPTAHQKTNLLRSEPRSLAFAALDNAGVAISDNRNEKHEYALSLVFSFDCRVPSRATILKGEGVSSASLLESSPPRLALKISTQKGDSQMLYRNRGA